MKYWLLAFLSVALLTGARSALAAHEGYVVCQNSISEPGQDCYANWNSVDGDQARQLVAHLVAVRFGVGCIPWKLWPEMVGGCKLDLNDTFEVCRTATGPCYRYQYNFSSELPVVGGSRPSPSGNLIEDFEWIPYGVLATPIFYYELLNCQTGIPLFGISAGPSTSVPAFFEIEKKVGSSWVDAFTGYSMCIANQGSGKTFRARAINPDNVSAWVQLTTFGICDGDID